MVGLKAHQDLDAHCFEQLAVRPKDIVALRTHQFTLMYLPPRLLRQEPETFPELT